MFRGVPALRLSFMLGVALACAWCRRADPPVIEQVAPAPVPAAPAPPPPPAPPPREVAARVASDVSFEGYRLHRGDELAPGRALGAPLPGIALDFDNGARVELEPHSNVFLPKHDPGAVILVSGSLHLLAAGQARDPRMPIRIATDTLAGVAIGNVEAWLHSGFDTRSAMLIVFSGALEVDAGGKVTQVAAGQSLAVHGTRVTLGKGVRDLAAARALKLSDKPHPAGAGVALQEFATKLEQVTAERRAQYEASTQQRDAHMRGDEARAKALQAEIVARAGKLLALQRSLTASYERHLGMLWQGPEGASPEDLQRTAAAYADIQPRARSSVAP